MKNFQQNLLIIFALALCLLCAAQWYRETGQRKTIESVNVLLSQKVAAIQDYTNRIRLLDTQVAQMDGHISELNTTIKTNDQLIVTQKRELNRLETENESLTNQIIEYKRTVTAYQVKLKEVADGVQKQNEALKELAAQRDEFVGKLNDSIKERNTIVEKYNELAKRVEELQGKVKP
jgi:chromosome segregation ATPase